MPPRITNATMNAITMFAIRIRGPLKDAPEQYGVSVLAPHASTALVSPSHILSLRTTEPLYLLGLANPHDHGVDPGPALLEGALGQRNDFPAVRPNVAPELNGLVVPPEADSLGHHGHEDAPGLQERAVRV